MANISLLYYELKQAGLPVEGVSEDGRIDYSQELTAEEQSTAEAVVAAHDPDGDLPKNINAKQARQAFLDSALANKSPQQIFTHMQGRMDNWSSLADARGDLRKWLPLMAAVIVWPGNELPGLATAPKPLSIWAWVKEKINYGR